MLKTKGYALGFQHFPQDLANVIEWKIILDPFIRKHVEYILDPYIRIHVFHQHHYLLIINLQQ